ncbi:glycosyltransferase involved in cell wall biosynthesis [Sinobacterium caligoides]|uniref:Glycosyltransferase involved in cell wall biosynthesis n=1 Tax=Sinobacterium caligoides TaxID=933926 RepID=A0A3N2DQC4_9GAMM|nr:glycosyltransferase family 4 protein [Sinobacterium caligoides]ROS01505.1 glycosyltransferase involved in cell wall biosynthesis [Sinobacterium caligoides]
MADVLRRKATAKTVIHVIRRFVFAKWGGTESVVWHSIERLKKHQIPSQIVATAALDKAGKEVIDGCEIYRYPYFYPHLGLRAADRLNLDYKGGNPYSLSMAQHLRKADCRLIHCHSMQRVAAICRIIAKRKGIPYIISLHGGYFLVPQSEVTQMCRPLKFTFNIGRLLDAYTRPENILDDASGIICVGDDEHQLACKHYPSKPILRLPNGVDIAAFKHGDGNHFRELYGIPKEQHLLMSISRIDPQKNQLLVLQLLLKQRQEGACKVHAAIIGPVTSDEYYTELKDFCRQHQLIEQVTFIEGIAPNSQELVDAYHAADTFILASIHEPFGIVALEAWASSTPIIATRVGGLGLLINDNVDGLLFESGNLEQLSTLFDRLRNDQALHDRLCKQALERVSSEFSWDHMVEKLIAFYDQVEEFYYADKQKKP